MCESVSTLSILMTNNSLVKSPISSPQNNRYTFTISTTTNSTPHFITTTACLKPNHSQIPIKFDKTSKPIYQDSIFKETDRKAVETEPMRESIAGLDDEREVKSYQDSVFKKTDRKTVEMERKREKTKRVVDDSDEDSDLTLLSSGVNHSGLDDEREAKSMRISPNRPDKDDDDELGLKLEEFEQKNVRVNSERKKGRQLMKRSNLLAKQVISIQSALSLGFVSQLWVDTISWVVLVIEVKPNLLSGEVERFFLEDVRQVGDVVLIEDEGVMENDLQMAGLETLVGYDVITPGRQSIGKVRGYSFNINSGAVESLELDSFGISIIPSSLVSSYALLIEDVLEVISDTVVVHEAAVLRIQRLTKGLWGSPKLRRPIDEVDDYTEELEIPPTRLNKGRSRRRTSPSETFIPRKEADLDDWELPKDYL